MSKEDRDVIVKIRFKAHPSLPDITDVELVATVLKIEMRHNETHDRRIHIEMMD